MAIVRLEQFYPWPAEALSAALGRYRNARDWVWAQEESQNMGGWAFVGPRLRDLTKKNFEYVGRDASASAGRSRPDQISVRGASLFRKAGDGSGGADAKGRAAVLTVAGAAARRG